MSEAEIKRSYTVTDVGGARPDIAGKRRRVGETITLSETEAEFEIGRGLIIPEVEAKAESA